MAQDSQSDRIVGLLTEIRDLLAQPNTTKPARPSADDLDGSHDEVRGD